MRSGRGASVCGSGGAGRGGRIGTPGMLRRSLFGRMVKQTKNRGRGMLVYVALLN